MPDVTPKHALVLYIPLSELGVASYIAHKNRALVISPPIFSGGMATMHKPVPDYSKPASFGMSVAKYGIDFVFAKRVSQPPRRQTPVSEHERADLARQAIKILASR